MTLCKMVENCSLDIGKHVNDRECHSELEGTKHLATIIVATKGAIVVRIEIDAVLYTGVLLDTSNSGIAPSLHKLPAEFENRLHTSESTVTVEPADCEIQASPVTEVASSTCEIRRTYLLEPRSHVKPIVIPSRSSSLAASLLRHEDRRQLRERKKSSKGKLYLCSMCQTHCLDTDHSDIENINTDIIGVDKVSSKATPQLTTPPIRISFKSPEGPSIMEIEPREYRKRRHSSKHKSKKHSRRSKKEKTTANNNSAENENPTDVSTEQVISDNSADLDSADDNLVIDLPGEHSGRLERSCRSITKPVKRSRSVGSSSAASDTLEDNSQSQSKTKTKARLRKQKYGSKAMSESADVSVVSEKNSRFVSTYESAGGKRISVGDIIWGKIIGFPWWPGRVCAISVSENKEGIVMGHTADIDWYCSPTKSHLPCSDVYPFLEDFTKRLDKKKKTKSYLQAVDEAKRDAVMNEQYMETLADEEVAPVENSHNTVSSATGQSAQHPELSTNTDAVSEAHPPANPREADERGNDSPSLLIDAFLRTNEQSNAVSTQMDEEFNHSANQASPAQNSTADNDLEGCLTISLPSPQSLLDSH